MTEPALRLLYVDDDAGLRRLVQKGLERRGFAVETAGSGPEGVSRVREGGIDVVVLDHYMPGQDGLATLAELGLSPDRPPVVYVTGTQESSVAVAALKAGASDYVLKTVGDEFLPLLQVAIEGAYRAVQMRRAKEAAEEEVRLARDRFEALAAERALLIREVNHRVGNSLQIIAALLHLQSSASHNPDVKSALDGANRRVMAVAQVHRRLYTSDDLGSVALDQYLKSLMDDLRGSAPDGAGDLMTLAAEPLEVDPDHAVAVGVIVTELVLNALKYAYPNGSGPVRVALATEGERATLSVEDDGVGRDLTSRAGGRSADGLGRMIVRAMATKLGAEWGQDEAHRGMRVVLDFPLGHPRQPPAAA